MWISTFVFCGFVLCAAADWTTKIYDVIVVGAGPAGIIGILICNFPIVVKFNGFIIFLDKNTESIARLFYRLSIMDLSIYLAFTRCKRID